MTRGRRERAVPGEEIIGRYDPRLREEGGGTQTTGTLPFSSCRGKTEEQAFPNISTFPQPQVTADEGEGIREDVGFGTPEKTSTWKDYSVDCEPLYNHLHIVKHTLIVSLLG